MGKPKFSSKKYDSPSHPWKEERIKAENELIKKYGLKNKREIWKAATKLRKYRGQARELLARSEDPQVKKETNQLLQHLTRYNILPLNSTLDDVLALDTEAILARRLQTLAYLKGFANTPDHARQLISHGHIAIGNRRITVPSYRVTKNEENMIGYTADSALNDVSHPARPSSDFKSKITQKLSDTEDDGVDIAKIMSGAKDKKPVRKEQKPPMTQPQKPKETTVKKETEEKVEEKQVDVPEKKSEEIKEKETPKEEKKEEETKSPSDEKIKDEKGES
jgi:small subunit ribosomal protein S4